MLASNATQRLLLRWLQARNEEQEPDGVQTHHIAHGSTQAADGCWVLQAGMGSVAFVAPLPVGQFYYLSG